MCVYVCQVFLLLFCEPYWINLFKLSMINLTHLQQLSVQSQILV